MLFWCLLYDWNDYSRAACWWGSGDACAEYARWVIGKSSPPGAPKVSKSGCDGWGSICWFWSCYAVVNFSFSDGTAFDLLCCLPERISIVGWLLCLTAAVDSFVCRGIAFRRLECWRWAMKLLLRSISEFCWIWVCCGLLRLCFC